jgi:hypothetical protein
VAAAPVPQTPGIVAFTATSPVVSQDLSNTSELTPITLEYKFTFTAGQGPATRDFRFRLDISAPANPDALFAFMFSPSAADIDPGASSATKKVSKPIPMVDGSMATATVTIMPMTGSKGNDLKFIATVESATDGVTASIPTITITVKN